MKSSKNLNIEDLNTDIAVIGSGGGGLMTAVTAAQKGTKVIVLEKRSSPGGNSVVVEGIFAAESAPQKRQGIDAGRDKLFKMAMDYAHWTINPGSSVPSSTNQLIPFNGWKAKGLFLTI